MSRTIAIFGPGLLGGSLLMALRARQPQTRLQVWARRAESLEPIHQQGLADVAGTDPEVIAQGADLIVLCTPVGAMSALAQSFPASLNPGTIVTDVGSVKASIHRQMAPLAEGRFLWLGSHPMAGSEQSGIQAARASLFEGSLTLLTPDASTHADAIPVLEEFWKSVGSRTIQCSPGEHDRRVALISHLPHLLAAILVNSADPEARSVAGPGFRDVTRIAAGPPAMWTEILLENKEAVLQALNHLEAGSLAARRALERGDPTEITTLLDKACQSRRSLA
jgi:prephenate dehydrogenase